ncbi:hypothetical protein SAMN05421788_103401 [Filimonas lacunae]|uniref:Lipocalin-like domain-containing protein n=1 Tax=Filimonas lacunae TaxID=477680 RepID=A0A173MK97_9BACT|nr:hypothetical protein [Filimonas lacunae]BAV08063.1 hypothetical protein FLA_4096 [Filimonas lacunae]SIT08739.1 hypothetical protein SAMN05421788_103401 [Filimonas lacunae]
MKRHLLPVLLTALLIGTVAQAQQLEGVYAGAELYNTPFNGMQISYLAFYLRKDKTFSDKLDATDWQTHKSGTYSVNDGVLQLVFANGEDSKKYRLSKNGNLESTAGIKHTLHKLQRVDRIPEGYYQMKSADYSGGMGTGTPGVFSSASKGLYFDGKGHFSLDGSRLVSIGGDAAGGTVAGKFEKNKPPTGGTYQLTNGEIVLQYNNGTVSRHSFFYSPPKEEDLVLLDGVFYFKEEPENTTTSASARSSHTPASSATSSTDISATASLLEKLRQRYGGIAIDKIVRLKEVATISPNLEAVTLTDISNQKMRIEIRQGGKLLLVKMMDKNSGWQWQNGAIHSMAPDDLTEMRLSLYQGVLGLHQKLNTFFMNGTVSSKQGDYMVTFSVNDKQVVYLVGGDYSMKGNAYSITGKPNISVYKKFIQTEGISFPSVTESSDGSHTITVTTTAVVINPVIQDTEWAQP